MSSDALACFDDLMTEKQVCQTYHQLLGRSELRKARSCRAIQFVSGKKGVKLYRPIWIAEYFKGKVTECQPQQRDSGNMADTGSAPSPAPTTSTPIGTTSEQDERTAEVLRQKFSRKRKID